MICLNKMPLFNEKCSLYTGGICHENFLVFLNPMKCEVDIFNRCFKKLGTIETDKYQSITENKKECYFILTKQNDKDHLYKTTYDFLEFDSIELHVPSKYKTNINDIYYDDKELQIIIATDNYIYAATTDGYFVKEISTNSSQANNVVVQGLNGCCMRTTVQPKPFFRYTAIGICKYLYVTYNEKGNTYLAIMEEGNCLVKRICLGNNKQVVSIFICCNKLYLLVIKNNHYNYLYETDICCKNHKSEECMPCCKCCEKEDCHPCCKDPAACLLESVALIETSLSHILNAEGEKIQKAIADDANIYELLEINNSVTESIFNVTMLEHALQKKMEKALQYDRCKKKCNHCSHDKK